VGLHRAYVRITPQHDDLVIYTGIPHPSLDSQNVQQTVRASPRSRHLPSRRFLHSVPPHFPFGGRILGGLQFDSNTVLASIPGAAPTEKYLIPGPVVEETFRQTPGISRYWNDLPEVGLTDIQFSDPNIRGPFDCWVDWILAWLRLYEMQMMKHPRLEFCRGRITMPLRRVIQSLEAVEPGQWLQYLKKNEGGEIPISVNESPSWREYFG
jgi:hypothetical protein